MKISTFDPFNPEAMLRFVRTNASDPDFRRLVHALDRALAILDGADHAFYATFNVMEHHAHVIVAYDDNKPVGCGAIKEFGPGIAEVKRMYVPVEYRKKGIATGILGALEKWAGELDYKKCVLETGKRQPEAIALYLKNGYMVIPNYGQYAGMENSICFEKNLT